MDYPALYVRQDRGHQSMKQNCTLNERKDKSLASIILIYILCAYIKYNTYLHVDCLSY